MVDVQLKDDFRLIKEKLKEERAKDELKALNRIYNRVEALDRGMKENNIW